MSSRNNPKINSKNKKNSITDFKLTQLNPCVAGIDIGASSVFVCVGFADCHQEVREYLTFTADLKNMCAWFEECGIKSVAMESTGVYWIPVYDLLAQVGIEVILANARHLKTVPGRKTDVKDCQWIQQLHAYGLIQGSFRPDNEGVILRGYVRQRGRLFESASQQVQLMHKALTQMNLQINHVLSDITGSTGMRIIRSIVKGERDPKTLASYRHGRCQKDVDTIAKALCGNYREEHLLSLKQSLEAYDFFHNQIIECEKCIQLLFNNDEPEGKNPLEENLGSGVDQHSKEKKSSKKTEYNRSPYSFDANKALTRKLGVDVTEVPGIDANGAMRIIAETGSDMTKWPSSKHFASWLGVCPGTKISGGKVLSSKTKASANRAAYALRLAANSLYRSKTALGAFFRRMRAKLGAPKAITAVAHKLAVILYEMIKNKQSFIEIGQDSYENAYKERRIAQLKRQAKELGYELQNLAMTN